MAKRPRLFIASSSEHLDVAYAVQEELERELEVTVWSQGVFELSRYTLESLEEIVRSTDFAMFVFAPDDMIRIRGVDHQAVRDNVVFELGLFLGALGRERCFVIMPSGSPDLKLPSDLLGLTTGYYDPNRQDANLRAALGPACNKVRSAARAVSTKAPTEQLVAEGAEAALVDDDNDALSMLESWLGGHSSIESVMRFAAVDAALGLCPGMTRKHIGPAAGHWDYYVKREGKETFMLARHY